MFRTIALLIYVLPNLYVCLRLRKLFNHEGHKRLFTVFYIILVLAFPATEFLSHNTGAGWAKYFLIPGYYTLPFLLYLFFLVLVSDIFRGINRSLKIVPEKVIRGREFRLASLCIFFVFSTAIVIIGSVNLYNIRVEEYHIEVPRESSGIRHLKIVMASDFHLGQMTDKQFLEKVAAKINSLNPDIVLMPGDIVEGDRRDPEMAEFERLFRQMESKYGVYASMGNHEHHGQDSKLKFFRRAGIHVLEDTVVKIDDAFYLAGRNDSHSKNRKSIGELLLRIPSDLPIILLDHRPTDIRQAVEGGVDIQVSGHTHNGQLFPFNYLVGTIYEIGWGYRKIQDTHFFVTSGIQVWGPPVRTAGYSEIVAIDVDFKD